MSQNNLFRSNIEAKIEDLRDKIKKYDHAYYIEAEPIVNDREYDAIFQQLIDLEKEHPDLITQDSPTQRVGGEPLKEFDTANHNKPMLSLANTYNYDELRSFDKRVRDGLEGSDYCYSCELKYDGVAISLIYKDLKLDMAITRGDGSKGDVVTQNIRTIASLPLKANPISINGKELRNFEVRGEVYLDIDDFIKINQKRSDQDEKTYANPRNLTAGTLKLLDSKQVATRPLKIVLYYLDSEEVELKNQSDNVKLLKEMGFPTSVAVKKCCNFEEVIEYIEYWNNERSSLPFHIDGVVLKVDSIDQQEILGRVSRSPRWAIAYKYEAERAETVLKDIKFQVGRIGTVTPVAELEPVFLDGSTVSRATLHNEDYIINNDFRVGDTVLIEKSGDIIPKVLEVIKDKRPENSIAFEFPKLCPCENNSEIHRPEGEANYYCDHPECPWQIRRKIEHFVSRNAMNIEGLGESAVKQFIDNGLLKNIADIYELPEKRDEIINLERWAAKSADNLINSINNSKLQPFNRVLYGIGIRFIGENASKIITNYFNNLDDLIKAKNEELEEIHEIGSKMAESIVNYFSEEKNIEIIQRLKSHGLKFTQEQQEIAESPLSGQTFVFTGELESMSRRQAAAKVESLGGKSTSSVSKKTNYVVVGSNPGSKKGKAEKLGVSIIDEAQFLNIIEN